MVKYKMYVLCTHGTQYAYKSLDIIYYADQTNYALV